LRLYIHILIVVVQEYFSAWFDDESYLSPTLCSASQNSFSPAPKDNVVDPDFSYDIEVRTPTNLSAPCSLVDFWVVFYEY